MKKMRKKALGLMLAVCLVGGMSPAAGADVRAQEKEEGASGGAQCQEIYEGSNIGAQDYSNSNFISQLRAKQATSYLTPMPDGGFMRVQAQAQMDGDGGWHWVLVEYYDASRKLQVSETKRVKLDLPRFGGFYAASDAYYILSGQKNFEENADTEVLRITKYDKGWNRISSEGLKDCNTAEFFTGGCTRMEAYGRHLLIHTSHTMYKKGDGLNHQANATIQYDMQEGKFTDYFTAASHIGNGYVSHSWNQFLHMEDGRLITVDHGDGYPRSIVLVKYPTDVSTGKFLSGDDKLYRCHSVDIMEFPGGTGEIWTGASVGGFEISDSSYLVAGNSAIRGDERGNTNNVFVAAVDKGTDEVTTTWLTDYAEGDGSTSTPHMVKLSDSRFVVLWSRGERVHYVVVDGKGNLEASYDMEGSLSDCEPVMAGGKVTWYTWDNEKITFYDMDCSDLSSCKKTTITAGHPSYEFAGTKDGIATFECSNCGKQKQEAVYTSYRFSLYNKGENLEDESDGINFRRCWVGDKVEFYINAPTPDSGMEVNNEWSIEVSDEGLMRCTVEVDSLHSDGIRHIEGYFEALSPGAASISICPKYNPDIKKTYDLTINSRTESLEISQSSLELEVGETVQIEAVVKPDSADQRVEYMSSSSLLSTNVHGFVSVNEKALVTAMGRGTVWLYVSTSDGKFAKCDVTIRKHAHVMDYHEGVAASCTQAGKKAYYECSKCKKCYSDQKGSLELAEFGIPALGHDFSDYRFDEGSASDTKDGTETAKCSRCDVTDTRTAEGTKLPSQPVGAGKITEAKVTLEKDSYIYDGKAKTPAVAVELKGKELVPDIDYTVSYHNNVNVGTAAVTVTGMGNYSGSKTAEFTITKAAEDTKRADISKADVTLSKTSYAYDGKPKTPSVTVKLGAKTLSPNTDYTVSYSNNINVGTAKITVTGKGNYIGSVEKAFTISKADILEKEDISKASVVLEKTSYAYDGKPKTPSVTVKLGAKTLSPNTDYTVSYSNNTNVGTAKATVTGKGNYTGSKSVTFTITKDGGQPDAKITCKKTVYKVAYGAKPFKINASSKSKMAFISSNPKVAAVDKSTGKVIIKNTGVATITIKAGKASKKVAIKVSPKKPSVKSAKAAKGRKLAVKWAKDKRASGYQVQVSTDKKFKKGVKSKKLSKTSYTFTKLKTGKKYYVRVRSYKKSGKETLYSLWSRAKLSSRVRK